MQWLKNLLGKSDDLKKKASLGRLTQGLKEIDDAHEASLIRTQDGEWKPRSEFAANKLAAHDFVTQFVKEDMEFNEYVRRFKRRRLSAILQYLRKSYSQDRIKLNGKRPVGTLWDISGLNKVRLDYNKKVRLASENLQKAKALAREIFDERSDSEEIKAVLKVLVSSGSNPKGLEGLTELEINHPRWHEVQALLKAALKDTSLHDYMRSYTRTSIQHKYQYVQLNYTSIDAGGEDDPAGNREADQTPQESV